MGERSPSVIDEIYARARALAPGAAEDVAPSVMTVATEIRVLALRTPTLPPAAHTNVYLVGPDRGPWTVIDPGSPYPDQQAHLDALLEQVGVSMVALTHHHGDHVGGAAALAARWNVPVVAHPRTAQRLDGVVAVTRTIEDGESVSGLAALHTPGHADGHLCFARDGVVIAGDMVAGVGTILIDPDEGDMALYLASLERLLATSPAMLLPAHGPAITDARGKLREYLSHRRMREDRVLAALGERPVAATALLPVAYADTPTMLWPLAERSLLAHLVKLERDGRARSDGSGGWSRL